ncbi:RagB/SusD family nutrient uptake outer membrane protein [Niabella sp. W65]|nr:RagB/SusD family nutrient uptake outer membrane protein [Niabella sp. W65]MCH7365392.1 RagB/SusD family nutrient uptake outer membrane protein [Niabella sp. W65]
MKAEALAMLNRYAEAEEMINLIREHCNIPKLNQGEGEKERSFSAGF